MRLRAEFHAVVFAFSLAIGLTAGLVSAADGMRKARWDFEKDQPGLAADGIKVEEGEWVVAEDSGNRVLSQAAENDDPVYNVALAERTSYKDLELSVRVRAVAGTIDQGGGLVWRAKNAKNYYIARYNPLEDNYRVYKVVDGKRTQLGTADVPGDGKWHALRVTMRGDAITCELDGKKYLEAKDATFPEAGKIGLWSKADAQSYFDDLAVSE